MMIQKTLIPPVTKFKEFISSLQLLSLLFLLKKVSKRTFPQHLTYWYFMVEKKIIILIFFFGFFSLWAAPTQEILPDDKIPDFRIATLPKAGTHLLVKCLYLLEAVPEVSQSNFGGITLDAKLQNEYGWHLSNELLNDIYSGSHKYLIMVRDVRDAILSINNWMPYLYIKLNRPDLLERFNNSFGGDFNKRIYNLILENPKALGSDVLKQYHLATRLFKDREQLPNVMFIKYEDLIGEKGGGNLSLQCQTIKKIADFLDLPALNQNEIEVIAEKLWGGTETFNASHSKGQIGTWKNVYTTKHIRAIKRRWKDYLTLFEYENTECAVAR